jgi:hypothetical protein
MLRWVLMLLAWLGLMPLLDRLWDACFNVLMAATERDILPDFLLRRGIRLLLAKRLREVGTQVARGAADPAGPDFWRGEGQLLAAGRPTGRAPAWHPPPCHAGRTPGWLLCRCRARWRSGCSRRLAS